MAAYTTWLKQQLADYKTRHLGVAEHGLWHRNGRAYAHILPEALYEYTIIETYRQQFWHFAAAQPTITRHPDFHHLNSSQAMGFNLFYPFFADGRMDVLTRVVGIPDEIITDYAFEHVVDPHEATHFDVYLHCQSGMRVFFELKLSEDGFGKAPDDASHRAKLKMRYAPRLAGTIAPDYLLPDRFFTYYQLLRNIAYLHPDSPDTLVFVFPQRNTQLVNELRALWPHIAESIRHKIHVIHLETFVEQVLQLAGPPETQFAAHYRLFQEKYIGFTQHPS